jgi:catechol 2,3-dioxygenase-like lactoylglutathione lyase family enzyme
MRINFLELQTLDPEILVGFYRDTLGLPVEFTGDQLRVRAGWTDLTFVPSSLDSAPLYHFAFNIPENQVHAAMEWTAQRAEILADQAGQTIFPSESWNADAFYFKDPAGNILELIARHDLHNATAGGFNSEQILCVSEIGLGTEDVPGLVDQLQDRFGISPFKGERSDGFTAVGDNEGLYIVVQQGRIWRPDTGVPAELLPVHVNVDVGGVMHEVRGTPYIIS